MKDSVIFYKSFYEIIKELPDKSQLELYNAIFKKYFYGEETELKGLSKGIFGMIVPNIDSANKRYFANVENGKKGGRPKKQIETQQKPIDNPLETQQKPKQNLNDKDNDNVNVNENVNVNLNVNDNDNIFEIIEQNLGRPLSPIEYEKVNEWEDNELTRYVIKDSILKGKYNIKYMDTVLYNYKKNNITTVQQAQEENQKFKEKHTYKKEETIEEMMERIYGKQ